MDKKKFEVQLHMKETASLNRPAWTSTPETGMFNAFNHKHVMDRSRHGVKFIMIRNFFKGDYLCQHG